MSSLTIDVDLDYDMKEFYTKVGTYFDHAEIEAIRIRGVMPIICSMLKNGATYVDARL